MKFRRPRSGPPFIICHTACALEKPTGTLQTRGPALATISPPKWRRPCWLCVDHCHSEMSTWLAGAVGISLLSLKPRTRAVSCSKIMIGEGINKGTMLVLCLWEGLYVASFLHLCVRKDSIDQIRQPCHAFVKGNPRKWMWKQFALDVIFCWFIQTPPFIQNHTPRTDKKAGQLHGDTITVDELELPVVC